MSSARCESLQITAPPCAVRRPLTAHAFDPGSTSARNPRCPTTSPSASSSSRETGADSRPPGGTASGDPSGGRVSSRAKADGPMRASSTALASLCCHWPISTCRTRNAATECHACHGSTGYRPGSGGAPSAIAALTPLAYASNAVRAVADITATSRWAAAASPSRRASTSPPTAPAPPISAHRPQARRRS